MLPLTTLESGILFPKGFTRCNLAVSWEVRAGVMAQSAARVGVFSNGRSSRGLPLLPLNVLLLVWADADRRPSRSFGHCCFLTVVFDTP